MTNPSESHLLEDLSDLEHKQWLNWSETLFARMMEYKRNGKTLTDFINDMGKRWSPNWKDYKELDWDIKEYDREYARQVLRIIREYMK